MKGNFLKYNYIYLINKLLLLLLFLAYILIILLLMNLTNMLCFKSKYFRYPTDDNLQCNIPECTLDQLQLLWPSSNPVIYYVCLR